MATEKTEQAALEALARGWSVVPVAAGQKRPLVRWEEFQRRRATAGEVRGWLARWPDGNLGIVTGAVSERGADEALRPVSVLNAEELQRRLQATVAATLESEPGLAVTTMGPAAARPVVRLHP